MVRFESANVLLREVTQQDLEMLRLWRNDPAIRENMCDRELIGSEQQRSWFHRISQQPENQHFVAEYRAKPIGYVNLKLKHTGVYEAGLYMGEAKYRGSFLSFLMAIAQLDYAFEVLRADSVVAQVLPSNAAALRFNEKLGYQQQPSTNIAYIDMKLRLNWYTARRQELARFIR